LSIFDYNHDGQPDICLRNLKQPTELLKNLGGPRCIGST